MLSARWPRTEGIKTAKQLSQFQDSAYISVVYYGSQRSEEQFEEYIKTFAHYHDHHIRFGNSFEWDLTKRLAAKLPCIEVKSKHSNSESLLCKEEITEESIHNLLEKEKHEKHKLANRHHTRGWFVNPTSRVLVFFHRGIKTHQEISQHTIFQQHLRYTSFVGKTGEANVNHVNLTYKALWAATGS